MSKYYVTAIELWKTTYAVDADSKEEAEELFESEGVPVSDPVFYASAEDAKLVIEDEDAFIKRGIDAFLK